MAAQTQTVVRANVRRGLSFRSRVSIASYCSAYTRRAGRGDAGALRWGCICGLHDGLSMNMAHER